MKLPEKMVHHIDADEWIECSPVRTRITGVDRKAAVATVEMEFGEWWYWVRNPRSGGSIGEPFNPRPFKPKPRDIP